VENNSIEHRSILNNRDYDLEHIFISHRKWYITIYMHINILII
ncbi:uncharacterized protein METZ01_LOCUS157434, partial [marine metagenome]